MTKLQLNVSLPATMDCYDVQVPAEATLGEVTPLIAKGLAQVSQGRYISSVDAVLCDYQTGSILNINMSLWDLGLRNGSKLILI